MKQKFSYFIVLFGLILLSGFNSFGQNTSIKVLNADTEKPVPYAEIVLSKMDGTFFKGMTTDSNGVADFNLNQSFNYQVLFMGYETREGQIGPGEHITIELKEEYDMLDDVVVTGQYAPQKADKSIYKIDVVDSRQMEQRGVNNLAEALSLETNIRLTEDPQFGTSIEIQGMRGEGVKYLIDGIPIVGRVGSDIDLSQINMDNVDHVEIVQGPMSVVYGTSAIAGVINIITKKNTVKKNIAKVNGYADNNKHYNFGFYASMIRGKHTFSASGSRNMFQGVDLNMIDGNIDAKDDRLMEFKPKLVYNGDIEYAYNKNDFRLSAKSSIMNSELRSYLNPNYVTTIARDRYFITLRNINSITVSDKLTESLSYNFIGSYTYFNRDDERIEANLHELTHNFSFSTATTFHNLMTRGNFTWMPEGSKLNYQFGWDINHDQGSGERIDGDEAEITDYAGFVSAQWAPLENISVQPGLRLIHNTQFDAPVIPSINFQWSIVKDLSMRLSYAKGFRAPSLKELYLDFQDSNHDLTGNPDLEAETTNSYNGSLTYKFKRDKYLIKVEPSVYYNDGKDKIVMLVTNAETNSAAYFNYSRDRTFGANFNMSYVNYSGLTVSAGYSLTGNKYDMSGTGDWSDETLYDNITFSTKYNFKKWDFVTALNYKFYGDTPTTIFDDGMLYDTDVASYSDLELTFSKQFFNRRLNLVAGGKNLLDNYTRRTIGVAGRPDVYSPMNYGRTFFIKANFRITK
ncbi:MAG: TonB-dependent receptor [Bacteroidota bacterium]